MITIFFVIICEFSWLEIVFRIRRILGITELQEIHKVRIDWAKRLLQETERSIPKIAEDVVFFSSGSYFIQVFKSELGVTPSKYRQIIRNR
jgi:AraC-like DNA-binding protein